MIDFCLDEFGGPIQNDDISILLQQIDLLFDTKPKEVLGQETFGTKYDTYLYNLKISNSALRQVVLQDLYSLDLMGFEPEVEIHLLQGTEKDIVLIDITLTRDDEYYQQIYKID